MTRVFIEWMHAAYKRADSHVGEVQEDRTTVCMYSYVYVVV